jgi:hypothetical protein
MHSLLRRASTDVDPLYTDSSPRTPYAAVAYPQGRRWRDRLLLQLPLALMLMAGLALMVVGLVVPSASMGHMQMRMQPAAADIPGQLDKQPATGAPRHVLVLDAGSSGSRV